MKLLIRKLSIAILLTGGLLLAGCGSGPGKSKQAQPAANSMGTVPSGQYLICAGIKEIDKTDPLAREMAGNAKTGCHLSAAHKPSHPVGSQRPLRARNRTRANGRSR